MALTETETLMAEMDKKVACQINGRDITVGRLRDAFEKVQNPDGWKLPYTAEVPLAGLDVTMKAIEWFLAADAKVLQVSNFHREATISHPGYQAW